MFKKSQLELATRRVAHKKTDATENTSRKSKSFFAYVCDTVFGPFRTVARIARRIWSWIRRIDLIGLLNLTLLIAIIVLFSTLTLDIIGCHSKPTVTIADAPAVAIVPSQPQVIVSNESALESVTPRPTLPIKRDPVTRKYVSHTITVAQTHHVHNAPRKLNGDIIIDRRTNADVLTDGVHVNGNLYLQNMRKYTLPCGAVISGNLFLRDVNMLQFCGDFTVKGNIYVSPRSSFGPIPRTARIGGQVIL